ncbi:hypothetical protein BC629DRAFT_790663 [Irpex lacteus]|nr:hypothetical protein BC629DRAFT_790663 [Irpex lacteus]
MYLPHYAYGMSCRVSFLSNFLTLVHISFTLAICIASILSDIIVLLVTWYRTFGIYLETRRVKIRTPLLFCLLRDGTLYFFLLFVIHVLQLITAVYVSSQTIPVYLPNMLLLFSPIVICRFLLNLREVDRNTTSNVPTVILSDIRFGGPIPFIAAMGESLHFQEDLRPVEDSSEELYELSSSL